MEGPTADQIVAAAERLRGHVVATPLIGGLVLPGGAPTVDVRMKPEVLQPSGGLYFRGAMHWMLRQLGSLKGVIVHGGVRPVLAGAYAAAFNRVPAIACPDVDLDERFLSLLGQLGCEVRSGVGGQEAVRAASATLGYQVMPGSDDPDYVAGVATVGLELARELPTETEIVTVSPAELGAAVAHGLAAAGLSLRVEAIDEDGVCPPDQLKAALATSLRLELGAASVAALHRAIEHGRGVRCAVLGS